MKQYINANVSGCVRRHQKLVHKLPLGATVRDAIKRAGWFRKNPYPPSGIISVRSKRIRDDAYYCRRKFDFKKTPKLLSLKLKDGDMIVVQYDVSGTHRNIPTGLFI